MFLDRSAIQYIHRCSFCVTDLLCKDIHNVRKCKQLLKVGISCLNLAVYIHGLGTHDIFSSGGSGGGGRRQGHMSPPYPAFKILPIFMQFSAKMLQNNRLAPPLLGNPGSATVLCKALECFFFQVSC